MIVRPTSPIQVEISVRPPRTSGRNTMIEVAVEHTTAGSTSREPTSAARRGPSPFWRWRKMLSSTTTALSTSMPTASISPIIERMLSVRPVKRSSAAAASSENGMARPTTSVVTQLRRKTNRITVASAPPIMPAWSSPEIEFSISSPWLVNVMTRIPPTSGSRPISASTFWARRATATELAPDSLITLSPIARASSRWRP